MISLGGNAMIEPLYLPEAEIAIRVLGKRRADDWPLIAKVLEREAGMPPVNPVTKMRYWRAVTAWFDRYERVEVIRPGRHSGPELPCTPGRKRQGGMLPGEKPCVTGGKGRKLQASKEIVIDAAHQIVER
jgi:hypothetical protein